ncbi:hypothetical protein [Paracoccus spongiarum]|uniref:Uncharacterized protein n=1 Tax=Paracoccus spongiarum TaxID=3064387 RepID=A0ABT9JI59_9RHOB|nr:hypothetical protein [Paracoccus sp. 2205BS29-5]MDP5308732.1 hypothetical protein [Paracoccus sp. 2205BS29-5]
MLREVFSDKFGADDADRSLPAYSLEWLGETELQPQGGHLIGPACAAREADLTAREQQIADREARLAHDANVSFAERLASEGRLFRRPGKRSSPSWTRCPARLPSALPKAATR